MSSRRIAKVAEALRETISTTVLFGLKDPRVKNVTVLRTEVSPDLKAARVFVSVMGDETAQSLAMHGLRSARGYIQSQIAERLELRYTPILSFVLDPGIKRSIEASTIIRQALATASPESLAVDAGTEASDDETDEESADDELADAESRNVETIGVAEQPAADAVGQAREVPSSELEPTTETTSH